MPEWLIKLSEVMLFVCGAGSVFLLNLKNKYSKYGAIIGLAGQPFWLISGLHSQSWGIVSVTAIYTISFCIGIYRFWIKNNKQNKKVKNVQLKR